MSGLTAEPIRKPDSTLLEFARASAFRYLVVIVLGYAVDFGISIALVTVAGIGLVAAAVSGFSAAVILNYLALEFWAFRGERDSRYARRFVKYVLVALGTLAARAGFIYLFEDLARSDASRIAVLVGAAAFSLLLNFALTRFAVFGGKRSGAVAAAEVARA